MKILITNFLFLKYGIFSWQPYLCTATITTLWYFLHLPHFIGYIRRHLLPPFHELNAFKGTVTRASDKYGTKGYCINFGKACIIWIKNPGRRYLILVSTTTYRKHMLIYSHLFPNEHHLSFLCDHLESVESLSMKFWITGCWPPPIPLGAI